MSRSADIASRIRFGHFPEERGTFAVAGIVLVFLVFGSTQLCAQQGTGDSMQSGGIYPLPVLYYTPETGVAGGIALLFLCRDSSDERASSVTPDIIYTAKKQILVEVAGDQYFDRGRLRLVTYLTYQKYPNKFYGIGNNTSESAEEQYTPQTYLLRAALYRKLLSSFNVGPFIHYERVSEIESVPGGAVSSLAGGGGGTSAGLGLVANWDSRDNTFATQSGSYAQLLAAFCRSAFGSDYRYDDIQLDLRTFIRAFGSHVVAVQAFSEFVSGSPPFQSYAKFGGLNLLRGYIDGRYRDRNSLALQAEYRVPLCRRFGAVGFAGVAQVADAPGQFAVKNFWLAGGAGLRFAWNEEERVNIRVDFGAGTNSTGLYINLSEAF